VLVLVVQAQEMLEALVQQIIMVFQVALVVVPQ
jgi:hypothetical protein